MAIRKLARDIVVGDYLNTNTGNPDYPEPADAELYLTRIDRIKCDPIDDTLVFYANVEVAMIPGDPSDTMEMEITRYHPTEVVYTYTEAEADEEYRQQAEAEWEYENEQRNK